MTWKQPERLPSDGPISVTRLSDDLLYVTVETEGARLRGAARIVLLLQSTRHCQDAMDERDQLRAENEALRAFVHDVATLTEDARESVLEELTNWDHADVYRSLARIVTDAARLDALRKEGT